MKSLDHVTLVNSPSEIYELFGQLYPEMVRDVCGWEQYGAFTDDSRGITVRFMDDKKMLFSVKNLGEGWFVNDLYLIPAYVEEVPDQMARSTPASDIVQPETLEDLNDLFCEMLPGYREQVLVLSLWRRFSANYRGVMIRLRDRKTVLFAAVKRDHGWDASWPILVPAPEEEPSEIDAIVASDIVVFLD